MDLERLSPRNQLKKESWWTVLTLAYQSLGVVYGDLATSPLYVYKSTLAEDIQHSETNEEIFGVLSLVFWTLTLIPLLKYLADEDLSEYKKKSGDNPRNLKDKGWNLKNILEKHKVLQNMLLVLALIGTCMVIGDGVLTPAISGVSSRSMVKYESGYNIETVFDGNKLGIEPYAVEVSPSGEELIVLDSENSNIHKISMPLSRYGKPKLVSGSQEGYTGHVDGKLKEAKMNRPRGLAIDDSGNIYVADTNNMVIRKISDAGVSTIATGGRFSDDFDLIYVSSTCSLLVIDRGNQVIREIQLHDHDCSHHEPETDLHLGTALLVAAAFFGYMFALLVRRIRSLFSSFRHVSEEFRLVRDKS
ncbi:hypothetical protein F2Q69_00044833 [Brassica cretica]|uniref:K+ potassium transporter integral membrane domain-containing protein n=1 Tax=Brassica cretica TaxID=69181 RepID=A0A8S9NNG2_BRACR|nr:hypothetical protein F2Q69_00044833 [Brassica cretica]